MNYIEWIKLLAPILVGFGGAYFGSMLALNKFKKEKFWDERRSGYKNVVNAFEVLDCWSEVVRAESFCEPSRELDSKPEKSLREIEKYSKIGGMLFSAKFQKILVDTYCEISKMEFQVHNESLGDSDSDDKMREWRIVHATELRGIVSEALPKLIEVAKYDLRNKT